MIWERFSVVIIHIVVSVIFATGLSILAASQTNIHSTIDLLTMPMPLSEDDQYDFFSYSSLHIIFYVLLTILVLVANVYRYTKMYSSIGPSGKIIFCNEKKYKIHWIKDQQYWQFLEHGKWGYSFAFSLRLPKNTFDHGGKYTLETVCPTPCCPSIDHDRFIVPLC